MMAGIGLFHAQFVVQINQGKEVSAQPIDGRAVDHFDPLASLLALQADEFQEADLGNGVPIAPTGHDERRNNGQGQGNLDLHGGPVTDAVLDIDRSPNLLDVGFYDVHAHAAARNIRNFFGGGESGQKEQVQQFAVAQTGGLVGREQALFQRLLFDPIQIDPCAIIGDFDVDLPSLVESAQEEAALGGFPGGLTLFRRSQCRGRRHCGRDG